MNISVKVGLLKMALWYRKNCHLKQIVDDGQPNCYGLRYRDGHLEILATVTFIYPDKVVINAMLHTLKAL